MQEHLSASRHSAQDAAPGTGPDHLRLPQTREFGDPRVAKIVALDRLLSNDERSPSHKNEIGKVLKSCSTLEDLAAVVKAIGCERLYEIRDRDIRECCVQAVLGERLRGLPLPPLNAKFSTRKTIEESLVLLSRCLEEALTVCAEVPQFAKSACARRYQTALLDRFTDTQDLLAFKGPVSQLRECANALIAASEIALAFGISLTHESAEPAEYAPRWQVREIHEVHAALQAIPETLLLFTPRLCEICRVAFIDEDTYAERAPDGVITVSDLAIDNAYHSARMEGLNSLRIIMCHELGHAVQIGAQRDRATLDNVSGKITGPADPRFPFDEFLQLADWKIIERSRVKRLSANQAILLDGELLPLNKPINYKGDLRTFIYDSSEKIVYSYRPDTEFSLNIYSRESPWEDWAEGFAEYILLPERLLAFAPKKFMYFEKYIGKYGVAGAETVDASAQTETEEITTANTSTAARELAASDIRSLAPNFAAAGAVRQSLILAHLLARTSDDGTTGVFQAAHDFYTNHTETSRREQFASILTRHADCLDQTLRLFLDPQVKFFPALIAAMNAIYRGEDVGLLTARGNRDAHTPMLSAIEAFLGEQVPSWNRYFVNDTERNKRLTSPSTAGKKLEVLRDFALGHYSDAEGVSHPLSRRYERVIFYDDEQKNLRSAENFAKVNGLSHIIQCVDASKMSEENLWEDLMRKLEEGPPAPAGSRNTIRFFDVDGTLLSVPARMYVKDVQTGVALLTITQQEFAEHPNPDYWISQVMEERLRSGAGISRDSLMFDFDDFRAPDRIEKQVNPFMFRLAG